MLTRRLHRRFDGNFEFVFVIVLKNVNYLWILQPALPGLLDGLSNLLRSVIRCNNGQGASHCESQLQPLRPVSEIIRKFNKYPKSWFIWIVSDVNSVSLTKVQYRTVRYGTVPYRQISFALSGSLRVRTICFVDSERYFAYGTVW